MSQHNSISAQLSHILTLAHASDTFIYTPRYTRANGKVAGNISPEYIKLHNALNEIHSHHATGRENLEDYQHHMCTHIHTKQTANILHMYTYTCIQSKQVI